MAGPNPVNSNPITHKSFETNLQHVGAQRQAPSRKPDEQAELQDRVELSLTNHVTQSREGAENAAHVGGLQAEGREEAEQLLLPAPENEIAGLLPAPKEEGGENLPVPYEEHLPAVIEKGETLPVKASPGEIIDAEWEPVYPGTVDQGLSPYVPGGPGGGSGAPPNGYGPGAAGPAGPGGPGGPGVPPAGTSQADQARNYQQFQQEQQEMQKIFMQMAADRQKWMMEMWKIIQDTQTKMYEIMESAILFRAQTHDKINQMWDAVIRGV